jgi:hypothetical protein
MNKINGESLDTRRACENGYLHGTQRRELFPWNADVDHLHDLPPGEVVKALQSLWGHRYSNFEIYVWGEQD